jgi:hypothetical protein
MASGVEAVADAIEDGAEGLRDSARKRAGMAGT